MKDLLSIVEVGRVGAPLVDVLSFVEFLLLLHEGGVALLELELAFFDERVSFHQAERTLSLELEPFI